MINSKNKGFNLKGFKFLKPQRGFLGLSLKLAIVAVAFAGIASATWVVYKKGHNAGYNLGVNTAVSKIEQAKLEMEKANKEILLFKEQEFQKQLKEAQIQTQEHLALIASNEKEALELRKIAEKPPEIVIRYQECKYTDEDHKKTLELYELLKIEEQDSSWTDGSEESSLVLESTLAHMVWDMEYTGDPNPYVDEDGHDGHDGGNNGSDSGSDGGSDGGNNEGSGGSGGSSNSGDSGGSGDSGDSGDSGSDGSDGSDSPGDSSGGDQGDDGDSDGDDGSAENGKGKDKGKGHSSHGKGKGKGHGKGHNGSHGKGHSKGKGKGHGKGHGKGKGKG